MKRLTFERLLKSIASNCNDSDYPLCYTKNGQILTMFNYVLYIGTVNNARDLVAELNRTYFQQNNKQ